MSNIAAFTRHFLPDLDENHFAPSQLVIPWDTIPRRSKSASLNALLLLKAYRPMMIIFLLPKRVVTIALDPNRDPNAMLCNYCDEKVALIQYDIDREPNSFGCECEGAWEFRRDSLDHEYDKMERAGIIERLLLVMTPDLAAAVRDKRVEINVRHLYPGECWRTMFIVTHKPPTDCSVDSKETTTSLLDSWGFAWKSLLWLGF